jgi:hypothetical protein
MSGEEFKRLGISLDADFTLGKILHVKMAIKVIQF